MWYNIIPYFHKKNQMDYVEKIDNFNKSKTGENKEEKNNIELIIWIKNAKIELYNFENAALG